MLFSLQQENAFASARAILRKDGFGLKGLNKGLTATMCRHGIWNMCYFGFYHNIKELLSSGGVSIEKATREFLNYNFELISAISI